MKILITGGAGFIASNIADRYLKEGHEIFIIDDLSNGYLQNVPSKAKFYNISITSPELSFLLKDIKPEIVNHHAARIDVGKSIIDPVTDANTNIIGSLNLFEACRNSGVKKIIFASSGGAAYGEQETFPADEKHTTNPKNPYGVAKLTTEKYLQFYHWTHGIDFVALRYANIYGPRQNALGEGGVVAVFTSKLLKGDPITINGDGKQTRDYVFVNDVVECNFKALNKEVSGIYNVGTGLEIDVNQLAAELIKLTKAKVSATHGPEKISEQKRSCLKPGLLQKRPITSLSEGLVKTIEWYQKAL